MPQTLYTYNKEALFGSAQVIAGQLQREIEGSPNLSVAVIRVFDNSLVNGNIEVLMGDALDAAQQQVLDDLVAAHSADLATDYFDAVVDKNNRGNYTSVAAAFADGAVSVMVRDGVYIETDDIVLPDGGQLVGESQGNVRIVLANNNSVRLDGSGGVKQTSGTVSASNGSTTVTGTGTTFTALAAGQFIRLGTNFYEIASIESDTSLTLVYAYWGRTLTNVEYLAQSMLTGTKVGNIVIALSSNVGLFVRAVRHCAFKGIAVLGCTPNVEFHDCGDLALYELICGYSNGVGLKISNAHSILSDTVDSFNSTSHGVEIVNGSCTNVLNACSASNNNGDGIYVGATVCETKITDCIAKHNNACGVHVAAGGAETVISGSTVIDNESDGIKVYGSYTAVTSNQVRHNGGHGIAIDGADTGKCIVTDNQVRSNGGDGIQCSTGIVQSILTSNRVDGNSGNGMTLNVEGCVASGNIVTSNSSYGIYINGDHNNVNSNSVSSNGVDGIYVSIACDQTIIDANQVFSNTQHGLHVVSGADDTMARSNICKNNGGNDYHTPGGLNTVLVNF